MPEDADGDGLETGWPDWDCDDHDPDVYPDAPEWCGNGVDEDCDGEDLACPEGEALDDVATTILTGEAEGDGLGAALEPCGDGFVAVSSGASAAYVIDAVEPGDLGVEEVASTILHSYDTRLFYGVRCDDFDDDGERDLAFGVSVNVDTGYRHGVDVYFGPLDPDMSSRDTHVRIWSGTDDFGGAVVASGVIGGEGRVDLVVGMDEWPGKRISILDPTLPDGDEAADYEVGSVSGDSGALVWSAEVRELDGDGVADLIVAGTDSADGRPIVYTFAGPVDSALTVADAERSSVGSDPGGLDYLLAGDVDGDGSKELITGDSSWDSGRGVMWALNLTPMQTEMEDGPYQIQGAEEDEGLAAREVIASPAGADDSLILQTAGARGAGGVLILRGLARGVSLSTDLGPVYYSGYDGAWAGGEVSSAAVLGVPGIVVSGAGSLGGGRIWALDLGEEE